MGIVKGPYSQSDWDTMLAYKWSLGMLRKKVFEDKRNEVIKLQDRKLKSYLCKEVA